MDDEMNLAEINRERQNAGLSLLTPQFLNVFMRSLPGQMIECFNLVFNAGVTTALEDTLAQRRGTVQAVKIVVMDDTLTNLDQDTFTLNANGVDIITDGPLAYYSPAFEDYNDKREYVTIPQNSSFTLTIDRTNGVGNVFVFIMFYYSPTNILPPASTIAER